MKKPDHKAGLSQITGALFGDVRPCTQQRKYNMKSFAQRDFVNSSVTQSAGEENGSISNTLGKFVTLCLSTIGVIFSLYFVYLAHR
ncbi:hypothetical protein Q9R34_19310 [Enterobacter sp. BRE11]|nr:hypothetical protein [Enterobacter sp. BRE11]